MVLQKEGLTYCFFFPPLTIVKIETRQMGRSIFFPIPPGGWADSYHLTFLSEPFDLFVGPFENGFLLAVFWGYSSIGGGRNKNGTSQSKIWNCVYKVFPITEFILLRVVVNNIKTNWDFC